MITSAQNGEEDAWVAVYQHYYPKLYTTALHLCGASPETKDLVQDSFITAYLKLSKLKDPSSFESWIRSILIHKYYRWLKRKKKAPGTFNFNDEQLKEHLEFQFEQLPLYRRLYDVLAQLSENLRSVLLLRYFSSFNSYQDIATILSIPLGTVRSRLNEARLKLIDKWKEPLSKAIYSQEECEEWNHFYYEAYTQLHFNDSQKNKLLNHLGKSVKLFFPGGKLNIGYHAFEKLIIDDHKHGSWLSPIQVLSSGNISIIETRHFNSTEHPNHCPPKSVAVFYRKKNEVDKLSLHIDR